MTEPAGTGSGSSCLFCRIASGEIKSQAVYESDKVIAFMDSYPIRPGHVQVIPRAHFEYYDSVPPDTLGEIAGVAQRLAPVLRDVYGVKRVGFMFTGADITHAHAHVLPMAESADATQNAAEKKFKSRKTPRVPDAELQEAADILRSRLTP